MAKQSRSPVVAIIMGSESDLNVMRMAATALGDFDVPHEIRVVSAHRTPEFMVEYAKTAEDRGIQVIIAGAGGAAHLPGMVASMTPLPVIGVPIKINDLGGMDALMSIAQMPRGVPVATMAVDNATNAGLLAVRILALEDSSLKKKLKAFMKAQNDKVRKSDDDVRKKSSKLGKR